MDNSELYIKMCSCPEIQSGWKPKEGDFFAFCGDLKIIKDYEIWALEERAMSDIGCWNEVIKFMGRHFVLHFVEARECFVFLPRQDQIQEMVGYGLGTLVKDFNDFCANDLIRMYQYPSNFLRTMEQLWLAFYMKEKHSKAWEKDKWVDCNN